MSDLDAARSAVLRRFHRDLADDFNGTLPRVLEALRDADRDHVPDGLIRARADRTEAELDEVRRKLEEFAQGRAPAQEPAKPAAPRRTRTRRATAGEG